MAGGEQIFIKYIKENLPAGSTILELGSGRFSTNILSKEYKMISIEHDKKYIDTQNSTYINAPLKKGWYDIDTLQDLPKYDLLLVDGPATRVRKDIRMGFLKNIDLFNVNVPIIIHDVDRPIENKLLKKVAEYVERPYILLDEVEERERGRTGVIK